MKLCALTCFALCLSLFSVSDAAVSAADIISGSPVEFSASDALSVESVSLALTSIRLSSPQYTMDEELPDYRICKLTGVEGAAFLAEPGAPAVPQMSHLYRIPDMGGVQLNIVRAEYDLVEDYDAIPYPIEEAGSLRFEQDPAFYMQDAWYPAEVATISQPLIFRDIRVVTAALHPVQVNPVTRQARLYHTLEVEIVATDEPGINEITLPRPVSGAFAALYREHIRNLDEDALDDVTTTPGSYLILCRDQGNVNPWADSLAAWRTRCGYDVIVHRFANTPNAAQMKAVVQEQYDNAVPPLEYVCILGDPSYSYGLTTGSSGANDHFFAQLAGSDILPDIGFGRISASTSSEFATAWRKLMLYEREPYLLDTDWASRALLYAIIGMEQPTNQVAIEWADRQLTHFTGIHDNILGNAVSTANNQFICDALAEGVSLFYYAGYWIGSLQLSWSSCNNGGRHPVCVIMAGGTGDFANSNCVAEQAVFAGTSWSPKGAVAAMGYTSADEDGFYFRTFGGGFINSMTKLQIEQPGLCQLGGFVTLLSTYGSDNPRYSQRNGRINLIGDPALRMWTDDPVIMDVEHAAALPVGAREFRVSVTDSIASNPIADALVVVWENDGSIARALTDSSGVATLPLTVDSIGSISVTVTKRNHQPYLADVACGNTDVWVAVDSVSIDDDNINGTSGNADGQLNPGEVVDLAIRLKNFGTIVTETNITATLTSETPGLTVLQAQATYPDLPPNTHAVRSTFTIEVSAHMKNEEAGQLRLSVDGDAQLSESVFNLINHAGDPEYSSHEIVNGVWRPGGEGELQVTLFNRGALPLEGVTGTLQSLYPPVDVLAGQANFGTIAVGGSSTNTGAPFRIVASPILFNGQQVPFRLITETASGSADTMTFSVSCGTVMAWDPCGPDGFGYYAYDNLDSVDTGLPDFEYIDISGGLGEHIPIMDPGERTSITQMFAMAMPLPFEFTYYGQLFDTITVCSNGWAAFGNQVYIDEAFDRPIPAIFAPRNMVAVYWDDLRINGTGEGLWSYHDQERGAYIIQWHARGGGVNYSEHYLQFQLLVLDPQVHQSPGGQGTLVFLYNEIAMNMNGVISEDIGGSTIGIQNSDGTMGLQLARRASYSPGCMDIENGRSIVIQADYRITIGSVAGQVTDAETGLPIAQAQVSLGNRPYSVRTNEDGQYELENVLEGTYILHVEKLGYNAAQVNDVRVVYDSVTVVNVSMLHPEPEFSPDTLRVNITGTPHAEAVVELSNSGNGPLEYTIEIGYMINGRPVQPWDELANFDVTSQVGDPHIHGCEYALGHWYVSGSSGESGWNMLYVLDNVGVVVDTLPQPASDPIGWFDMAYDGFYLYGSPMNIGQIQGIDLEGVWATSIPINQVNPARALAYDPASDHFWIADMGTDIYEVNREGVTVSIVANEQHLPIVGLAWRADDPNGYPLYATCYDADEQIMSLWQFQPGTNNSVRLAEFSGDGQEQVEGCAIATDWNSMFVTLGAIRSHAQGDRLYLHNVAFDASWLVVTPTAGSVPPSQALQHQLSFDCTNLRPGLYEPALVYSYPVLGREAALPIVLDVQLSVDDERPDLPTVLQLGPNFPNPFNPGTVIPYRLPNSARVQLRVFNILGAEVATLVDELQEAGYHEAKFNGQSLPSGIYFARIESSGANRTAKMILLK